MPVTCDDDWEWLRARADGVVLLCFAFIYLIYVLIYECEEHGVLALLNDVPALAAEVAPRRPNIRIVAVVPVLPVCE